MGWGKGESTSNTSQPLKEGVDVFYSHQAAPGQSNYMFTGVPHGLYHLRITLNSTMGGQHLNTNFSGGTLIPVNYNKKTASYYTPTVIELDVRIANTTVFIKPSNTVAFNYMTVTLTKFADLA